MKKIVDLGRFATVAIIMALIASYLTFNLFKVSGEIEGIEQSIELGQEFSELESKYGVRIKQKLLELMRTKNIDLEKFIISPESQESREEHAILPSLENLEKFVSAKQRQRRNELALAFFSGVFTCSVLFFFVGRVKAGMK